jgi:hypothetical protein
LIPEIPSLDISEVTPEKILNHWLVRTGNEVVTQMLVKWSGLPESSATWKDYHVLRGRFSTAAAWGPVASSAGGDVTTLTAMVTASAAAQEEMAGV